MQAQKRFSGRKLDRGHCTRRKLNGNHCHVAVSLLKERRSCKDHQLHQMLHTTETWGAIFTLWINLAQWPDIFQGGMLLESHICVWLLQQQNIPYHTVRPHRKVRYSPETQPSRGWTCPASTSLFKSALHSHHSSGGWKSKLTVLAWSGSWWGPLPGWWVAIILLHPHMAEKRQRQLSGLFSSGNYSHHEGSALMTSPKSDYLQKPTT